MKKVILKNVIKKKNIFLLLVFLLLVILSYYIVEERISTQMQLQKMEQHELIEFKALQETNDVSDEYNVLVTITNNDGLDKVTYTDNQNRENIINCSGKTSISFDLIAQDEKDYTFKIKKKGQNEKNETKRFEISKIKGNYTEKNGIYAYEPTLSGFNPDNTRYLNFNSNGYLEPANWINDTMPDNWYDYKNQVWANIYVENNGNDMYYVWMPRYCFKLDQTAQTSDVKFIDVYNNYTAEDGTVTPWKQLKEQGYQVPDGFQFRSSDGELTRLTGIWMMKYEAGDTITPSIIRYDISASKGMITLKNVYLNTNITNSNPIVKYTVALNGKVVYTLDNITSVNLTDVKQGDNVVNITGLNENGEIVGSMTKVYSPAVVNPPELSAFDKDTTFYVTYDEDGKEHSTIPISNEQPENWYEYSYSEWANIVTRIDGYECYYVWIPRYEFMLDQTNQKSDVRFIKGTSTETDQGYQIPEGFTFNGQELTGIWMMKYEAGDEFGPKFDSSITATSSSIRMQAITGSGVKEGQVYKYYLNGQYKGETTDATKEFEYTGLNNGEKYTVLIEIRNLETDEYVGTIVKQITTIEPNKPDLSGFNEDNTYYVIYDETDTNASIGEKIKKDGTNIPSGWYDYSKNKWANIVQTNGTVENGTITGDTTTIYYVWLPRYEFRLPTSQYAQTNIAKSEVRFVGRETTNSNCSTGYQVPEGFTFNGKELDGIWMMKYEAGD